ncbi:MAG: phosphoribosylaminoimidazolecarboxamide formyltransferase [Nautiliaceae bacterium]
MLEPIINHQKEIKEIFKKMEFLRDNFNFQNPAPFLEELCDLVKKMQDELEYHFNLQVYSVGTNEKAKKFVMENMLLRDILFRMLKFIKNKCEESSIEAFSKFDDFEEILKAYLKKERGLFIEQLKTVLNKDEILEIERRLKSLL